MNMQRYVGQAGGISLHVSSRLEDSDQHVIYLDLFFIFGGYYLPVIWRMTKNHNRKNYGHSP
jgi:hypothetical protein